MRLSFLDLLRVFACMSVLIGHKLYGQYIKYLSDTNHHDSIQIVLEGINPFIQYGGCGLVVFFLISGYIITHVLQKENSSAFIVKRLFRIYPLYWVAVGLSILLNKVIMGADFPPLKAFLVSLSLFGDFFDAPYSLGGVEWSLRLEMLFYVTMSCLRLSGVIDKPITLLCLYFLYVTVLPFLPPFPTHTLWANGYVTLYSIFLVIGSTIYIIEKHAGAVAFGGLLILLCLAIYFYLIPLINPITIHSNFALTGFVLFFLTWRYFRHIEIHWIISGLANLTYSVYLFHFWLWDYLHMFYVKINAPEYCSSILIIASLLSICHVMNKYIEKPVVNMGRRVAKRYFMPGIMLIG